jgi:hypothetical protein
MKSLVKISLCLTMLLQSLVAPAQQDTDAAVAAIKNQAKWINDMVAKGKISPADANARLNELKLQVGALVLGTPVAPPAIPEATGKAKTPKSGQQPSETQSADAQQPLNVAGGNQSQVPFPTGVEPPAGCSAIPTIKFDQSVQPHINDPKPGGINQIDLNGMVRLNASESGGEIYTKSKVYVAYVNRLRYSGSLGGVVSVNSAPTIPFSQMITTSPLSQVVPNAQTTNKAAPGARTPTPAPAVPQKFIDFNDCYKNIQASFFGFQAALSAEEQTLNDTKLKITAATSSLQPLVETANEARSAADLTIFPTHESPPFPLQDLGILKLLVSQFVSQYADLQDWAEAQKGQVARDYEAYSNGANNISTRLDQYLASSAALGAAAGTDNGGGSSKNAATPSSTSNPASASKPGGSSNPVSTSATEASDYEAARIFVTNWRQVFRTVSGANDDYFIVTFTPACGGFFGNGTSTQMQLSISDSLNPPTAGAKVTPINLDSVVCQPTISVSSGLGLSFIPSQTPAFVPSVKTDAQGNPILDASGNPTIVQSLGYSSQSKVSAGYALQTNASLWATQQWGFEIHWSVGGMLTASTSGATTDIITGPSFSFRRRTFFVSPMYDLGLRTVYVSPFKPGMSQGNLTSPPTQQVWKSGLGLTITFPFSLGTKNTTSSNGGATAVTNTTGNNAGGSTPAKKAPSGGNN